MWWRCGRYVVICLCYCSGNSSEYRGGGGGGVEGENRKKLKFGEKVCYYIFYFVWERQTHENDVAESVTVSRRLKTPSPPLSRQSLLIVTKPVLGRSLTSNQWYQNDESFLFLYNYGNNDTTERISTCFNFFPKWNHLIVHL